MLNLQSVTFNWKMEANTAWTNLALWHKMCEILPQVVSVEERRWKAIYYSIECATLTPVLVEAIKELNAVNKEQQELINKLIEELKSVKEQIKTK